MSRWIDALTCLHSLGSVLYGTKPRFRWPSNAAAAGNELKQLGMQESVRANCVTIASLPCLTCFLQ